MFVIITFIIIDLCMAVNKRNLIFLYSPKMFLWRFQSFFGVYVVLWNQEPAKFDKVR